MTRRLFFFLIAALASLATAQAQFTDFTATLTPDQDGGGARTGTGSFTLSLSGTTLTIQGAFSGLSGTVNNGGAHIHGPGAPGQSVGVLYSIYNLITLSGDSMSGTINGSVDLVPNPNGTTFDVPTQLSQLNNELWYVNIHTGPNFGGGEIRGQILVPEPATTGLLAAGAIAGLMLWMRRRRS